MKERDIQTIFRDENKTLGVFELKLCKDNAVPFSVVKDHQRQALLQVSSKTGLFSRFPIPRFLPDHKRDSRPLNHSSFTLLHSFHVYMELQEKSKVIVQYKNFELSEIVERLKSK